MVRCGRCGKRMTVRYHQQAGSTRPDYVCARQMTDYGGRGALPGLERGLRGRLRHRSCPGRAGSGRA
ncbi:hypothetical protein ABT317_39705 [Streptomyces carpinensis]|uniref:Recombinase zinc beta ribbon domain-containing protein n=1 Tax=Streptomyces carpinensis TaxID=66369 RepID=A0ABV1WFS1_9ACTN